MTRHGSGVGLASAASMAWASSWDINSRSSLETGVAKSVRTQEEPVASMVLRRQGLHVCSPLLRRLALLGELVLDHRPVLVHLRRVRQIREVLLVQLQECDVVCAVG